MTLKTIALIAAVACCVHSFGATRNIALWRAVYQSSAADLTHVGHLVTDGKVPDGPLLRTEVKSEFPEKCPAGETPKMAFDGNKDTKWLVFEPKSWLEVTFPAPVRATTYSIMSANDEPKRDPRHEHRGQPAHDLRRVLLRRFLVSSLIHRAVQAHGA